MTITARDIQLKQFRIRFRGFDATEVDYFLDEIAESFINLEIQNERMRDSLRVALQEIDELKAGKMTLEEACQNAKEHCQTMVDESSGNSLVVAEARKEADSIIADARNRAVQIQQDIDEMIRQRDRIAEHVRKIVDLGSLLLQKNEEYRSEDSKVKHLRPI